MNNNVNSCTNNYIEEVLENSSRMGNDMKFNKQNLICKSFKNKTQRLKRMSHVKSTEDIPRFEIEIQNDSKNEHYEW